ncbi:hypothetical protein A8713_30650 [Streptomyces sp. SAT1]|uniref:hypothetical protein n=1 Tax=Streptomyces sp. SAT1 TaxID=1849967 RepID=UPI0007DDDF15|nr:hypothetical protein [Streptomyces sp. SAT1]ANH94995.1 hypothetical protein A8713_30650 [Streptomyces sp. SAT1]
MHRVADARDLLLREAVASLSTSGERVAALARRLSVSERHPRDLFAGHVGLTPKRFARIQRIRAAPAGAGSAQWAALAVDTGVTTTSPT